jgi:DNA repair protein RecN (Recombination protein N)
MLKRLEIQNYAIIDRLHLELSKDLSIITGETGAGKSILMGALGLVMGKRADTKVLFDEGVKCFVEATFAIDSYDLFGWFESQELDYFHDLVIRREISPQGKSRAFINDTPVTLDVLESLTGQLLVIHQQFDTQDIQKPDYQLQIIDALSDNNELLSQYVSEYKQYRIFQKSLSDLEERSRNSVQESEFLTFQLEEFLQANLREGEQEELESSLEKLKAAEDIKKWTSVLAHGLEGDENALTGQIQSMLGHLSTISHLSGEFQTLYDRLSAVREELTDMARDFSLIADNTEYDALAIQDTQMRLDLIYRLQKKHQVLSISDLLNIQNQIQQKLDSLTDLSAEVERLKADLQSSEQKLVRLGAQMTEKRKSVTDHLEGDVQRLLTDLSMPHARIKVLVTPMAVAGPKGFDDISILFAPNKGSQFLPLKDTASGGEMSRLALCIKSLIARAMTLPTLIFDEIDSGVSGEVAMKMGDILKSLANNHQVICITHSPQIASKARQHYWVYKNDSASRTVTAIKELTTDERIEELAKMLSGNPPTSAALANASELLGIRS